MLFKKAMFKANTETNVCKQLEHTHFIKVYHMFYYQIQWLFVSNTIE